MRGNFSLVTQSFVWLIFDESYLGVGIRNCEFYRAVSISRTCKVCFLFSLEERGKGKRIIKLEMIMTAS